MVVDPPDSGVNRMVDDEKGRVRRWRIEDIVGTVMIVRRKQRSFVRGFRLNFC